MTVTSTTKKPKEPKKTLINWYKHNRGTRKKHFLIGTIMKIPFKNYKQRDTSGKPQKSHMMINVPNLSKEYHRYWRLRDIWPRRK